MNVPFFSLKLIEISSQKIHVIGFQQCKILLHLIAILSYTTLR